MFKYVKKVGLIIFIFGLGFIVSSLFNKSNNIYVEEEQKQIKKHTDTIAMMLETKASSGNYEMTTRESWPAEGYIFNNELSKCENGGEVYWDNENKKVFMSSNSSDKCYVYFDVIPTIADFCSSGNNLSSCLITLANNGGPNKTNIYYHDTNLVNGAEDNSYRYAGANNDVNNYVCFGSDDKNCLYDNLYRIIGVFNNQVKLIKADFAGPNLLGTDGDYKETIDGKFSTYYEGKNSKQYLYYLNYRYLNSTNDTYYLNNTWSNSFLNTINLNSNYINNIGTKWADKIAETTWKVGGNVIEKLQQVPIKETYYNEIINPFTTGTSDNKTTYDTKIGLMYLSDYGYAALPNSWIKTLYPTEGYGSYQYNNDDWLKLGQNEATITRCTTSKESDGCMVLNGDSGYTSGVYVYNGYSIRPVFYLNTSITYISGDGTSQNPIRLS